MNAVIIILALSIVLQAVAVVLSLRLVRISGRAVPWLLLAAAILLMLARRSVSFVALLEGGATQSPDLVAESTALLISGLMVAGLLRVGPVFSGLYATRKALQKERDFVTKLVHASPAYFVAIAPDGKVFMMNEAMLQRLGYPRDDVLGTPYLERFVPPDDQERVAEAFADLAAGKPGLVIENDILTCQGEKVPVEWHGRPVMARDGRAEYFFGVGIDLTERRRAQAELRNLEAQLRQAQKMEAVGRLAGGIAHDFNNILTLIQGHAERTLARPDVLPDVRRNAQRILDANRKAADLTRQLLLFSRNRVARPHVVNLNDVCRGMDEMLRRTLGHDVELLVDLTPDLANTRIDSSQMEQVLLNLAVNARDAMPQGGHLRIDTRNVDVDAEFARRHLPLEAGPHVCLTVADDGQGMPPDVAAQIFEPFFTTKEPGRGTGLGLSIVYGVVKGAGGAIDVATALEQGTAFRIYLPATDTPSRRRAEPSPAVAVAGRGQRILVVEDNEGIRELIEGVLTDAGYRVSTAADGFQALQRIEEETGVPQLLITDVMMPGMSGRELAERLLGASPDLRVIYISGYTDNAMAHAQVNAETDFLQKPFSSQRLLELVSRALAG